MPQRLRTRVWTQPRWLLFRWRSKSKPHVYQDFGARQLKYFQSPPLRRAWQLMCTSGALNPFIWNPKVDVFALCSLSKGPDNPPGCSYFFFSNSCSCRGILCLRARSLVALVKVRVNVLKTGQRRPQLRSTPYEGEKLRNEQDTRAQCDHAVM